MIRPTFYPTFDPADSNGDTSGHDYADAVRVGDRIETSGQGGWDGDRAFPVALADEIARAFDNLGAVLAGTGASWDSVFAVESWHLPLDDATYALMVAEFRRWMPNHRPIWTALAVPGFGLPGMRVEIRVSAAVPTRTTDGAQG